MKDYDKLYISLKYYLLGRGYVTALKALDLAREYHQGTRKDGVTPEFQHQVEIALYLTTLKSVLDEEKCIAVAMLHDVMEDYDAPATLIESRFGKEIYDAVWRLTKKYKGVKKDPASYFSDISECSVSSLVKGADRIHNVQSMIGVFGKDKQLAYVKEVEEHFLPMLKKAKYTFPEQTAAYFNIIHMLKSQTQLIKAIHG